MTYLPVSLVAPGHAYLAGMSPGLSLVLTTWDGLLLPRWSNNHSLSFILSLESVFLLLEMSLSLLVFFP